MSAYYNEIEPFAAQWLRNLIKENLIAPGYVDERSIRLVHPADIAEFTQCHFFAGIGIWSHALRLSGWGDDRPVWTGSCPCQPFSQAGKRNGFNDDRHLWPEWFRLIKERRPGIIFGEQVSGPDGLEWFDLVSTDLESRDYAVGAGVICSAGIGAPNIRHRLFWMADTQCEYARRGILGPAESACARDGSSYSRITGCGSYSDGLANAEGGGCGEYRLLSEASGCGQDTRQPSLGNETTLPATGRVNGMGDASDAGLQNSQPQGLFGSRGGQEGGAAKQSSGPLDPWRELEWINCLDGKARPTQPGIFPLATRHPGDVGILRASGNAINAKVAQEFISAAMECMP